MTDSLRLSLTLRAVAWMLAAATLIALPESAAAQGAGGASDPAAGAVDALPARAALPAALAVSYAGPDERRPLVITIAPRALPRRSERVSAVPRAPRAGTPAAFTGPPAPCTGPCVPAGVRDENQCEDANGDRRCDIVFDPQGRGGFWRSLGRFLLLSWLWGEDDQK